MSETNQQQLVTQAAQQNVMQVQPQVVLGVDGKYKGVTEYHEFSSLKPQTRAEKLELFNMINEDSHPRVTPMKNAINAEVQVVNVLMQKYRKVDEETGEVKQGITTMIFDEKGNAFATSSKSVYWTLTKAFNMFGYPGTPGYEPLHVVIYEYVPQGSRNKGVNVRLIG